MDLSRGTQRGHHGECGTDGRRGPIGARRPWWLPMGGHAAGWAGPRLAGRETLLPHPAAAVLGRGRGSEDLGDSWSWEGRKGISGRSWDRWSDGSVSGEGSGPPLSHYYDCEDGRCPASLLPPTGLQFVCLKCGLCRAVGEVGLLRVGTDSAHWLARAFRYLLVPLPILQVRKQHQRGHGLAGIKQRHRGRDGAPGKSAVLE